LLVIVDQVGHKKVIEGLKTTEQIEGLFGSCLLVLGTSFHSKNEVGIYDSSDQPGSRYFVFGEPHNEDEVISFLKLYQSSKEQEAHPDVDEQILNELIASYYAFKEKERGMEEEEEKGEQDPSSLWILFREVTGFVPLTCWKVIKNYDVSDELLVVPNSLEERLDFIHHEIVDDVTKNSREFYKALKNTDGDVEEFQDVCELARDNYLQQVRNNRRDDISLSTRPTGGNSRNAWDLRFVNCLYDNQVHKIHTPIALSGSIAAGLQMV